MTTEQILAVQAIAVQTDDTELLIAAWAALGYDRRVAFLPATEWQRQLGIERCRAALATV